MGLTDVFRWRRNAVKAFRQAGNAMKAFRETGHGRNEATGPEVNVSDGPVFPTKALAKFLSGLNARQQPVLLDLGPVVGPNVNFFGEQLGCKIFVEDLAKDIDRHAQEGRLEELGAFLAKRFPQETGSIDGILCWDLFDYLDKKAAKPLAEQLARVLRPDGVMLAFFNTTEAAPGTKPTYTRHVVVDQQQLQYRTYPAARARQKPMVNRDIQRLFEPLRITEQFLMKTNLREVLFRKPGVASTSRPEAGAPD